MSERQRTTLESIAISVVGLLISGAILWAADRMTTLITEVGIVRSQLAEGVYTEVEAKQDLTAIQRVNQDQYARLDDHKKRLDAYGERIWKLEAR
jgi:hypothetical protein